MDPAVKQFSEAVGLRLMVAQLVAWVASKEADPAAFVADLRAATLGSLEESMQVSGAGVPKALLGTVSQVAQEVIEHTYDTIGRMVE